MMRPLQTRVAVQCLMVNNMKNDFKVFADCKPYLSESPMWHKKQKMLYWRGLSGEIYRKGMTDSTTDFERFDLGIGGIGSMVFTDTDEILIFGDKGKIFRWVPYSAPILYKDLGGSLFNDCIADPKGRIFCGMLAENYFDYEKRGRYGKLLRIDTDGSVVTLLDRIGTTPNGIRFSPDFTKLYFAVTDDECIYEYDYDAETGDISGGRVFASGCCPDGIAVDEAGNVWNTYCLPGRPLQVFSPCGELIREYFLPVRRVLSVAFGGEDGKTVFVTTAHENEPIGEHDGAVFYMKNDLCGGEEFEVTIK